MFADTNLGRWTLNHHIPYVSQVTRDWVHVHEIGMKINKYPRLFGLCASTNIKLPRKYPPRLIWVTAYRSGITRMGWRFWSQEVK